MTGLAAARAVPARAVVLSAATGAAVALAHVGPGITWLPSVRLRCAPRLSGLGAAGHLALTFDDGPDPRGTPVLLAALDDLGWRATFFMLGSAVRAAPGLAAEVAAAGHEVAVHGDTHRYLLTRTPRGAREDLARGVDAVGGATGAPLRWFRPPYGVLTSGSLLAARRLALRPVLWSAWGRDWVAGATPRSVVDELSRGVLDGGTALLHDCDATSAPGSWRATAAALPLLAEEAGRRGLRVGPLGEHGVVRQEGCSRC